MRKNRRMCERYRRRAVFESDQVLSIPEDDKGYFLEKDGVKYHGNQGRKTIEATFTVPFRSSLLIYDFSYDVIIQVMRNYIFVRFNYADLHKIYKLLLSNFKARFRLRSVDPIYDLLELRTPWPGPCNEDFLLLQFKHNPDETLRFVKDHIPELVTIMSLNKIPRKFDEKFRFITF